MGEARLTTQLSNRDERIDWVLTLQRAPRVERGGQGAVVEIVEFAADRHTLGEARQLDAGAGEHGRRCNARWSGLRPSRSRPGSTPGRASTPGDQPVDRQILGADPVERRQGAAEHVIAAAKGAGAFERPEIGEILDDADRARRRAAGRGRSRRARSCRDCRRPGTAGSPRPPAPWPSPAASSGSRAA